MSPNWFIAFPMQVEGMQLGASVPPRVRLFAGPDLHVTLAFFGGVEASAARAAFARIRDFESFHTVQGSFSGVEPLGNPRKPSALSAIVQDGKAPLGAMIADARGPLLEAAGAPEDTRPPLPHMTLARIQRRATGAERREALRWASAIDLSGVTFRAESIALYTWADDRRAQLFQIVARRDLSPTEAV